MNTIKQWAIALLLLVAFVYFVSGKTGAGCLSTNVLYPNPLQQTQIMAHPTTWGVNSKGQLALYGTSSSGFPTSVPVCLKGDPYAPTVTALGG